MTMLSFLTPFASGKQSLHSQRNLAWNIRITMQLLAICRIEPRSYQNERSHTAMIFLMGTFVNGTLALINRCFYFLFKCILMFRWIWVMWWKIFCLHRLCNKPVKFVRLIYKIRLILTSVFFIVTPCGRNKNKYVWKVNFINISINISSEIQNFYTVFVLTLHKLI